MNKRFIINPVRATDKPMSRMMVGVIGMICLTEIPPKVNAHILIAHKTNTDIPKYTPHVANGTADDGVGNRPRTVEIVLVYATYQRHQYPKQMPTAAAFAPWCVRYEQPNDEGSR